MRYWLSRLAFSFLVLACVFAWQAYRLHQQQAQPRAVYGSIALVVVFGSLALAGMRERHR